MSTLSLKDVGRDLSAGIVVYLVALPLCLGIALASDAPLASGLITGILGGLLVAVLSGSQTSVSGPAAGLAAVVGAQIIEFGFAAFLVAVFLAGVIQVGLGVARSGFIAAFFPSSVIKGLLAAIGVLLILKQLPHVFGHDDDAEGDMAFQQPDGENSFSEIIATFFDIQPGAALIGLLSIALLWGWDRIDVLRSSPIPGALMAVLFGMGTNEVMKLADSSWAVEGAHLVTVPVANTTEELTKLLAFPDWSVLQNPAIYVAGFTLALVASLETLLNLDAVDELDPQQRRSPPNRELVAQGIGNMAAGLVGGLPMTSVIVRSSVNISAGNKTKLSTIIHGALLLGSVLLIPHVINSIPLSALAAILFVTGLKLAKPALFRQMWKEGKQQFLPFAATIVFIVATDLLTGVLIGLGVAIAFILHSNFRRPLRLFQEHHLDGDVLRIQLASQVSFFNRASLDKTLREVPRGGHVLLDARDTNYVDPDILDLIHEFRNKGAPAHGVRVSMLGFKDRYPQLPDEVHYVDHSTKELQSDLTPRGVLEILKSGNRRFRAGERLTRDLRRQVNATAPGQSPLAVVLSCIDSRTPAEHVFDLGIGDIFSVRIAGNVARQKVLASVEYSCKVARAKLIVVMGHTACGAVTSSLDLKLAGSTAVEATGCQHLDVLVDEIQRSITPEIVEQVQQHPQQRSACADEVARRNVLRTMRVIREESSTISELLEDGSVELVGAMYDVRSGAVEFFMEDAHQASGSTALSSETALPAPQ